MFSSHEKFNPPDALRASSQTLLLAQPLPLQQGLIPAQGHQSRLGAAQGRCCSSFRPHRDGLVLNPSEQDLGAVCGNLSKVFPLLPVPGKSLVHQLCCVTILPRAGAARAKPALFFFFPLVFTKHTSRDGADEIFLYFPLSLTALGPRGSTWSLLLISGLCSQLEMTQLTSIPHL